jgi:DNA repair exonuclease SbcCD ATPase subunit
VIALEEIAIQNFLSFGPRQTLQLDRQGLVFVEGENRMARKAKSNGSGKSGLIEAPVWCLTGRTMRDIAPDTVVNRRTKKDCLVELRGNKDGVPFSVVRGRRVQNKNILDFVFDGKNLTSQGDPKETQRQIRLYLGIDYDVLTNTVVFNGQDEKWRFTSIGDAAQKQLLDKILGIEVLGAAQRVVKAKALDLIVAVSDLATKLEAQEQMLATLKRTLKVQRRERVNELIVELRDARRRCSSGYVIRGPAKEDLKSAKHILDKALASLDAATTRYSIALMDRSAATTRMHAAEQEEKLWLERAERAKALKSGERCNVCGSEIAKSALAVHACGLLAKRHEAAKRSQLESDSVVRWTKQIGAIEKNIINYKNDIAKAGRGYDELQNRAVRAEASAKAFHELEARVHDLRAKLRKAKRGSSPALTKLKVEIKKLKAKITHQHEQHVKVTEELAHYNFWCEGFGNSGVKSLYLDYVVPVLNQRAQRYANILSDGMVVEFDSESQTKKGEARDKFRVMVTNEQGADSYEGNSGGEKRKVDIVVARALQSLQEDRAGGNLNVAWYDEVFESLDSTSSEAVLNLLIEDSKRYSSLFVVSHQEQLRSYFPRVLRVIKDGGFSFLEWG